MTSAVSLILQQLNPGPINEVYEKILFAGLESGFFKQSKLADNCFLCGFNTKRRIKLTEKAES